MSTKACEGCRIKASDVCAYCSNTGRGNVWLCNIFACNSKHVEAVHPRCKCGTGVYHRCKAPGCSGETCRKLKCRLEHQMSCHPTVGMDGMADRCPLHDVELRKYHDNMLPVCPEKCVMACRWSKRDVIEWQLGRVKALIQAGEHFGVFPTREIQSAGFLLEFTHRIASGNPYRDVCEIKSARICHTQTLRHGELVNWIVVEVK